jgi:MFS family permease
MPARRLLVDIEPLRTSPQFRRLWLGYLVSVLGAQLTVVAVPYQVYRLTHSSLDVGLIGLAQILPVLFGALAGGSIADAVDRRRVLLVSQTLLACCSLGLFWNASTSHPRLWPLYVLAAASAGFAATDVSTRAAVFANLVERRQLAAANALWQLLFQIGSVVGPGIAGLLIAHVGVSSAYAIDASTFLVSLAAVFSLRALPPLEGGTRFGWRSIKEGLGFLRGRQALQATFVIDLDAMILGLPRALFPALGLVRFRGGAQTLGLLYAAPGAGALVGASLTGWVASVRRHGRAVLVAVAIWGLAITLFGLVRWLPVALGLLAVAGAADVISAVFRGTIMQTEAPDALRGRVSSIHTAVVTGGPRLGDVEAGVVASLAGVTTSVVSGGLGCLVGVALVWRFMPKLAAYVAPEHGREVGPGKGVGYAEPEPT